LEAARQIRVGATPPRRTVRVVLFANEENGGAGADAYAAAHASELASHVLAMEADFGDGRAWALRTVDRGEAWGGSRRCSSRWASCGTPRRHMAGPTSARCTSRAAFHPPTSSKTARATSICITPRTTCS